MEQAPPADGRGAGARVGGTTGPAAAADPGLPLQSRLASGGRRSVRGKQVGAREDGAGASATRAWRQQAGGWAGAAAPRDGAGGGSGGSAAEWGTEVSVAKSFQRSVAAIRALRFDFTLGKAGLQTASGLPCPASSRSRGGWLAGPLPSCRADQSGPVSPSSAPTRQPCVPDRADSCSTVNLRAQRLSDAAATPRFGMISALSRRPQPRHVARHGSARLTSPRAGCGRSGGFGRAEGGSREHSR